jgi:arylsulfatase A-like enzyme
MGLAAAFLALAGGRPNVVLIRTDDLDVAPLEARRPDDGRLVLENVHALLAERGTTFRNFFVSYALCAPSRATLLSGQYAHNHHVYGNVAPFGGYGAFDHTNSLATWLQAAGYHTVHMGKYFHNDPGDAMPPGWSEWYGFHPQAYYDYHVNENGTDVYHGHAPSDYQTDVLTGKAVAFVRAGRSDGQPFFLEVDYFAPHRSAGVLGEYPPAPRHQGILAAYDPVHGPAFGEADVSDKPLPVRVLPPFTPEDVRRIDVSTRGRLGTLLAVDEGVARIVGALEAAGVLEDTFVVFTSDNGFQSGEHRIPSGKATTYEESVRVPLLVRGPGVPAGRETWAIAANVDLAPTIVELTGAVAGRVMDGRSLVPLLDGRVLDWDRTLLLETFSYSFLGSTLERPLAAVRYPGGLYAEYDYDADGVADERELYDLVQDPFELESLHADPSRLEEMRRRGRDLERLRACAGRACP